MNLFKTSFYTSVSTAVTFISGFIVTKVIAVKIGPEGIAFLGQFQNITAVITMVATCAIINGVIKYLATHTGEKENQQRVISTAITITIIASFIVSVIVISMSRYLSQHSFHTPDLWLVYVLYGSFVTLISLNIIIAGIYNGLREIKKLTIVNITGSVSGIILTVIFANVWGVKGVLVAGNFMALISFLLNIFLLRSMPAFRWTPSVKLLHSPTIKLLFAFSLMNIISGILAPISQLIVRNAIIRQYGTDQAGYWQAVSKISDYYLLFITTVLSVYYVPRLAELRRKAEIKKEMKQSYKIIMPAVIVLAALIWVCRPLIIRILFTPAFEPMLPLFRFQLLGDILKISSLLFAFLMISKAMTKTFIITEIIFASSFVLLSLYCIGRFGVIGATYAFCINYFFYSVTMFIIMKIYLDKKNDAEPPLAPTDMSGSV